jgi:hypothetical protein
VVAVVTALASYGHMYEVALLAGEPLWIARAWPITVDGLVLVALRRGDQGRAWLALGLAVSVAANVLAKYPEVVETVAPLISAFPPVALYGIHRLVHAHRARGGDNLMGRGRSSRRRPGGGFVVAADLRGWTRRRPRRCGG